MLKCLLGPLTADLAVDLWAVLGTRCVHDSKFAAQCAHATLRCYEPSQQQIVLPAIISQERLSATIERIVNSLYKIFWSAVEGTATDEAVEDTGGAASGGLANGGGGDVIVDMDGEMVENPYRNRLTTGAVAYKLTSKPEVSSASFCYAFRLIELAMLQRRAPMAPGNKPESPNAALSFSDNLPMEALGLIEACLKGCLGRFVVPPPPSATRASLSVDDADADALLLLDSSAAEQLFDPKSLPTKQLLTILVDIAKGKGIAADDDRAQIAACSTLLLLSECIDDASAHAQADAADINLLLLSLESNKLTLRETAIKSLHTIIRCLHTFSNQSVQNALFLQRRLFIAASDNEPTVVEPAHQLFHDLGLDMNLSVVDEIFQDLVHEDVFMRKSATATPALLVKHEDSANGELLEKLVDRLCALYVGKLKLAKPDLVEYGVDIKVDPSVLLPARLGVAAALLALVDLLEPKLYDVCDFLPPIRIGFAVYKLLKPS